MAEMIQYIIIAIIAVEFLVERILSHLNERNWQSTLPPALNDIYDNKQYQQSRQYDKANANLSFYSSIFNTALIIVLLWTGGFAWIDEWVRQITTHPILMALLFFGLLGIGSDLLNLPFQLYSTFGIEEDFDFNRTDGLTFVTDKLKGYVLGGLIGGGLLALIVWFYQLTGTHFWIWAWLIITFFILFFTLALFILITLTFFL